MMPKSDTIDAIRNLNPTATPGFLAEFSNDDLSEYLDRLISDPGEHSVRDFVDLIELDEPLPIEEPAQPALFMMPGRTV
ncbi:MAG: hypothetical protein WBE26_19705 [Phycisphaerae bacterium]